MEYINCILRADDTFWVKISGSHVVSGNVTLILSRMKHSFQIHPAYYGYVIICTQPDAVMII